MEGASCQPLPHGWSTYPYTISGYRVNLSMREALMSAFDRPSSNNEFWMIWTDVLPIVLFARMHVAAAPALPASLRWQGHLMFAGAIFCRVCSLVYHVFNCVSLEANRRLIYLDMIGIASNALGVPWICSRLVMEDVFRKQFLWVFMALYAALVAALATEGMRRKTARSNAPRGGYGLAIAGLAVMGNIPAVWWWMAEEQPSFHSDRILSGRLVLGQLCFATGYIFFHVLRLPESTMKAGRADGTVWNSHVLWHLATALGQWGYLSTAMPI